ncbi:E3 SUMO-protein ligase ZBED1-like [Saccostrea cucullata]|uniref:E3 SUMO-protein ligase ZBED1-like n=1 Tax=Saccostrea cuccullata TaxID=36930 RepID=UPI002ED03A6E
METNVLSTRAVPESHTTINLAYKIKDILQEFNLLNKVDICVHDNARNIERAGELSPEWEDLSCFGNTLQLVIKPALDLPNIAKIIGKCRKLVGHFKHSTTLAAELSKRQKLLGIPVQDLIQDVPTRWNSVQQMMQRLTEQRRVLTDIMLDDKVTKKEFSLPLLKDHEWDLIDQLSIFLKDFAEVTTYMSTETHVSISQIYPIVCGLLRRIDDISGDTESNNIHRVRETVKDELMRRYKPTCKETAKSITIVTSFLDPRYKNLKFLSKDQRNITKTEIESLLDDLPLRDTAKSVEPPTKRIRRPNESKTEIKILL